MSHSEHKITIHVNQTPFHLEQTTITAAEIRGLIQAPPDYEVWKIIKSPDPEGQLPVDDMLVTGTIEIKSGDKFRVVPPGTFGRE
jgi:hypothetical protein